MTQRVGRGICLIRREQETRSQIAMSHSFSWAGDALFAFAALPPSQWKSARTTNAIERLHEEFKRRIKTQTVLPSADTAAMLFWALCASGQIVIVPPLPAASRPSNVRYVSRTFGLPHRH